MSVQQPQNSHEYVGQIEKITNAGYIASLLKRVQESRALLSVTVAGSDEIYNSAVIAVDPAEHYLLLDELNPPDGHARFLQSGRLHAHTRMQGVDVSFAGTLLEARDDKGIAMYKIALPAVVNYRQRRASFRAHVGAGLAVPVALSDADTERLDGVLCDISAGGIGARVKDKASTHLAQGGTFSDCHITLPHGETVHCALEVRFVAADANHRTLRFGGRFVDLDRMQAKLVEQFIAALEREHMRKRPKGE